MNTKALITTTTGYTVQCIEKLTKYSCPFAKDSCVPVHEMSQS